MVITKDPIADYGKLDLLRTVARAKPAKVTMVATASARGHWKVKGAKGRLS
jgi:hypothetical protein